MFETRIDLVEGQCLTLTWMASNVSVTGWEGSELLLRLRDGEGRDLTVEDIEDGLAVSARVACEVSVPNGLGVKVREAKANLQMAGNHFFEEAEALTAAHYLRRAFEDKPSEDERVQVAGFLTRARAMYALAIDEVGRALSKIDASEAEPSE